MVSASWLHIVSEPSVWLLDLIVIVEDYLKSRAEAKFDREDFDSLSNKFLSKLVIRAN